MKDVMFNDYEGLRECLRQQMLMDVLSAGINGVFVWMEEGAFKNALDEIWEEED